MALDGHHREVVQLKGPVGPIDVQSMMPALSSNWLNICASELDPLTPTFTRMKL